MAEDRLRTGGGPGRRLLAYGVHAFTASGAALALLALEAALAGRLDAAFAWLGLALIVDGVDGTLARRADVRANAPVFEGAVLDLVVDYATYVFVPAVILLTAGLLPHGTERAVAALVLVSAALYFADTRMKTSEGGFRGFPALWNILVFYLAVFRPDPVVALLVVLAGVLGQFLPIPFVHPVRVRALRVVNLAVLAAWSLAATVALAQWDAVGLPARAVLAGAALWFLIALPLARHRTGGPAVRM